MSSPPNHPTGHPKQIASGASFSVCASTGRLSRHLVTRLIVGGTALVVGVAASYFTSEQQRLKTFELSLRIIDPQGRLFMVNRQPISQQVYLKLAPKQRQEVL